MAKKGSVFNKYSPELKLKVVEAYLSAQYGGGARVAKVFGVRSASQVKAWTKLYQTEGVESLSIDKRVNSNNPTLGKHFRERDIEDWPLDKQIEYLKMENAILKKVKALRSRKSGEPSDI